MPATPTTSVPRPGRWDVPFDPSMTDAVVDRVLSAEPFRSIDAAQFPGKIPLRGVLKNDTRLVRYKRGDLVVREGDYGDAAYFVLGGFVRVVLERGGLPPAMLGRATPERRTLRQLFAQLFRHRTPEYRNSSLWRVAATGARDEGQGTRVFLQDVPGILDRYRTARIGTGEFFGEIAALGRTPRTASVFADEDGTELLEIRWQGLKELRRYAPAIQEHIDRLYRQNSLLVHLRETPLFRHLSPEELAKVAEPVRFESHGSFDWFGSYKSLAEKSVAERLEKEPVIAREGEHPEGVILIRSGFARVSRRAGAGEITTSYLGRGEVFGLEEIAHGWQSKSDPAPWQASLRALGYVDVLVVPTAVVERHVLPQLPKDELPPMLALDTRVRASSGVPPEPPTRVRASSGVPPEPPPARGSADAFVVATASRTRREAAFREFLVENRFINGHATMLMDLDRCVHCDACVEACSVAHDGNPRFLRHGTWDGRSLVANACMHCADPVCMIGCPTGAIHRAASGPVVINDATCIGCTTCARSCPYDNIRMVEARDGTGRLLADEKGAPILKATKCDLCIDQWGGPACQRACPHDALARVDLTDPTTLSRWLAR